MNNDAYLPTMNIWALEEFDIHVWAKPDGGGLLELHNNAAEWLVKEPQAGFIRRKLKIDKGTNFSFSGKLTHAGDGLTSNFRLFASANKLPDKNFIVNGNLQSYYQLDGSDDEEGTGYYVALNEWIVDAPEKVTMPVMERLQKHKPGNIKAPGIYNHMEFYERIRVMWDRYNHS